MSNKNNNNRFQNPFTINNVNRLKDNIYFYDFEYEYKNITGIYTNIPTLNDFLKICNQYELYVRSKGTNLTLNEYIKYNKYLRYSKMLKHLKEEIEKGKSPSSLGKEAFSSNLIPIYEEDMNKLKSISNYEEKRKFLQNYLLNEINNYDNIKKRFANELKNDGII